MPRKKKLPQHQPWGRATALLVGSAVTLIGVVQQIDPEVILFRVLVASSVSGLAVAAAAACMRSLVSKP